MLFVPQQQQKDFREDLESGNLFVNYCQYLIFQCLAVMSVSCMYVHAFWLSEQF